MKAIVRVALFVLAFTSLSTTAQSQCFVRAEANCDGSINLSDPVFTLNWLFRQGPEPCCLDAADVDDDGRITISDPIFTLVWLFRGGPAPGAPTPPVCGPDPTVDTLGCRGFFQCPDTEECRESSTRIRLAEIEDRTIVLGETLSLTARILEGNSGDGTSFRLLTRPTGMTISSPGGELSWRPGVETRIGRHDVTVAVTSGTGSSDFTSFVVTLRSANLPPIAADDVFAERFSTPFTVPAPGVLANDTDENGDALTAQLVVGPANGILDLREDGSFDYTPRSAIPVVREGLNLSLILFNDARAGSVGRADFPPEQAIDGDPGTSWSSSSVGEMWYEIEFRQDVTVRRFELVGPRNNSSPFRARLLRARVVIFDRASTQLWESGEVQLSELGDGSMVVPAISNAARVRVEPIETFNGFAAIGEFHVFGDAVPERFAATVEWTWEGSEILPDSVQAMTTPLVADIDLDGMPEIIFATSAVLDPTSDRAIGVIRVVRGDGGAEVFTTSDPDVAILSTAQLAVGNIDETPELEIIALASDKNHLRAFAHDGSLLWTSEALPGSGGPRFGGASLADLDGDGRTEILVTVLSPGYVVALDGAGRILWSRFSSGGGFIAGFATAADVDLDGDMEIVAGNSILSHDGELIFRSTEVPDGSHALGNFDDDPFPEVVIARGPNLYLMDHDGRRIWEVARPASSNVGAPPTVADFDGDGQAEIGLAAAATYTVFEADGSILWSHPIRDFSSGATGSTVFDFENDGSAEVVYSDEFWLWVFRGSDGAVLLRTPLMSGTVVEYPVVADVDADGHAEIVAVANQVFVGGEQHGLWVFGGQFDDWVRARPIWNQHDYHVTNVAIDGTIPARERPFWLLPGLNAFRMNSFLPEEADGADRFTYRASDGDLSSNVATVYIETLPTNTAPEIQPPRNTTGTVGFRYVQAVRASDRDRDPISFSLVEMPEGMTIDAELGVLRWLPTATGSSFVTVRVTDDRGFASLLRFAITVVEPRTVPDLRGRPEAAAVAALETADWRVGPQSRVFHRSVAPGVVIDQSPPPGTVAETGGRVDLVISLGLDPRDVDDDGDGFTENLGDCNDDDRNVFPGAREIRDDGIDQDCDGDDATLGFFEIVVTPVAVRNIVGREVDLTALAIQNDGTARVVDALATWESADPSIVTVDARGLARLVGPGRTTVSATLEGITGAMAIWAVSPAAATDRVPPEADITAPLPGETLTGLVDIVGTASDANFVRYVLEIAPAGSDAYVELARGDAIVTDGVLGRLDASTLLGDRYELRLTVDDAAGHQSRSSVPVTIEGGLAVGQFSLVFRDLTVPAAGFPIDILRSYDSRDKRRGDFGIGWRLGYRTIRARANRVLGEGWIALQGGLAFGFVPAGEHTVSVYLPDGRVEVFDFEPTPSTSVLVPPTFLRPNFVRRPGTRGSLRALDLTGMRSTGGEGEIVLLDDTSGRSANPQLFLYTDVDGSEVEIHVESGVRRIRDANGNSITISRDGVTHSAGTSVVFERDSQDRITRVVDPLGAAQVYAYSASGDLISHTDRLGATTRFKYDARHGLLEIIDPNGVPATRYEYDDAGRVIAVIDPDGNRTELEHDTDARTQIARGPGGGERVQEYDAHGNILFDVDELGNVTSYTYDSANRLLSETNPSGETTRREYDARGAITGITLPSGALIRYERDASGRMTRRVDALGGETRHEWDSRGNSIATVDALGHRTERAYDVRGNLVSVSDADGGVENYEYDALGRVLRHVDARGVDHRSTWDANGNLLSMAVIVSTPNGPRVDTTRFAYDAGGNLVSLVAPDGSERQFEHDVFGNRTASIAADGRRTENRYGLRSELQRVRYPDGAELAAFHTPRGQVEMLVSPSGLATEVLHDAAGRPTTVLFPDGNEDPTDNPRQEIELDVSGRATRVVTPGRGVLEFTRDEGGALASVSTSARGPLRLESDALGRVTSGTDVLGRVTRFEYDLLDRVTRRVEPDGRVESFAYDSVGRLIARVDAGGRTTRYEHNAVGQLSAVSDAFGGRTEYRHDDTGSLVRQIDALGRETREEYDRLGQRVSLVRPGGGRATFTYDVTGQAVAQTGFDGETTRFTRDARGRTVERLLPDGSRTVFEYDIEGRLVSESDARGTTRYAHDPMGRLLSRTEPDGRQIAYTWNADGYLATVTVPSGTIRYAYSAPGVLSSVTAPDGDVTRYTRDLAQRIVAVERPNGLLETREYDDGDRVTRLEVLAANDALVARFVYSFNAAGLRTAVDELGGRRVEWTYDGLDRLVRERIVDPVRGNRTISFTYDAVGNRIRRDDSLGGTTLYAYDVDDRLVESSTGAEVTSYTYDGSGRVTRIARPGREERFEWNALGRLVRARINAGGERLVEYTYDAAGLLVARRVDGVETRFLVDVQQPFAQIVEESASDGTVLATNVRGVGLASVRSGGVSRYPLADAHSGLRRLTDASGAVLESRAWDAWGEPLDTAASAIAYGYRDERRDEITGKLYLRARHLDTRTGRFLSTDPFEGLPSEPVSRHRYLYAFDNPIRFADPSGRFPTLTETIQALTIGAVMQQISALSIRASSKRRQVEWNGTFHAFTLSTNLAQDIVDFAKTPTSLLKPSVGNNFGFTTYTADSSCANSEVFRKEVVWLTPVLGGGVGFGFAGASLGQGFRMYSPGLIGPDPFALLGFSFFAGYTAGIGSVGLPNIPNVPAGAEGLSRAGAVWFSGFAAGYGTDFDFALDVSAGILTGITVPIYGGTLEACPITR